jgi:hypothetical protein
MTRFAITEGQPTDYGGSTVMLTPAFPEAPKVSGYVEPTPHAEPMVEVGVPPSGVWILGFFPRHANTNGSLTRFDGWFPCRLITDQFKRTRWHVQFGSYRAKGEHLSPAKWALMPADHPLDRYLDRRKAA